MIEKLVGLKIFSAAINEDHDIVILVTDHGVRFLTWVGDCCSTCFLAHVNGTDSLMGGTILRVADTEWKTEKDDREDFAREQSMGTTIYTDLGTATFETRLQDNGYYDGKIIVSEKEPIGQYSDPMFDNWAEEAKNLKLRILKDF